MSRDMFHKLIKNKQTWKKCLYLLGVVAFLCFTLSQDITVKADSFFPSGDARYCLLVPTVGFYLQSTPIPEFLEYDGDKVTGYSYSWVTSHGITDVADIRAGHLHRFRDIASYVAGPPGTQIGVAAWFYNGSGHSVDISESRLYLSSPESGDLTRNTTVLPQSGVTQTLYFGNQFSRTGAYTTFPVPRIPSYSGSHPPGMKIGTLTIKQPVVIGSVVAACYPTNDGQIIMEKNIMVRNDSMYSLQNVQVGNQSIELAPRQISVVTITETQPQNASNTYVGSTVKVSDQNEHLECAATAAADGDALIASARPFFVNRNDSADLSWFRFQPAPAAEGGGVTLCVRQIGYTQETIAPSCSFELKQEISVEETNFCEQGGKGARISIKIHNTGGFSDKSFIFLRIRKEHSHKIAKVVGYSEREEDNSWIVYKAEIPSITHGESRSHIFTIEWSELAEDNTPISVLYKEQEIEKIITVEKCVLSQTPGNITSISHAPIPITVSQEESLWNKTKNENFFVLSKLANAGISFELENSYLFGAVIAIISCLIFRIVSKGYVRGRFKKTEESISFSPADNGQQSIVSIEN